MRKVLFVASAVCLLASAFAVTASAAEDAWLIYIEAGWGGGNGSPIEGIGSTAMIQTSTRDGIIDDPLQKDSQDGLVAAQTMDAATYAQIWRPWNEDGSYGMFRRDTRRPLNTEPNLVKTWDDIIIWGSNSATNIYPADTIKVFISAKGVPNSIGGKPVVYKLVMTYAPESYEGLREWVLPASPGADNTAKVQWFAFDLPAAGAIVANPISGTGALSATQTAGYRFSLVTPEPGSMMVLASGLVGLVGLVSRRRSA